MATPDDVTHTDIDHATEPNDLERLFIARANARDLDELVALFEGAGSSATSRPIAGSDPAG